MSKGDSVLCVGHVNWDIVLHTSSVPDPDHSTRLQDERTSSGGSATNTALVLANLGVDVLMAGSVGDDAYGEKVITVLEEEGVTPRIKTVEENQTTVIRALVTDDADPRYLAKNQSVATFSPDIVQDWGSIEHMHITSFDVDISKAFIERATAEDVTISFNPSQLYSNNEFPHIVEAADVIFLNEREAELFRKRYNLGEYIDSGTTVIITHGGAGCTAYANDGVVNHTGFSSDTVVDTVGAGDSFVAGFLKEWLRDSENIEAAIEYANACGAASTSIPGAPNSVTPSEFIDSRE